MINSHHSSVALLFSGGRDSSLAACLLAQADMKLHLLSMNNGAGVKADVSEYRYKELCEVFPEHIVKRVTLPTFGLFRRVALANIEDDFAKYKKNLIPLGDALASHAEAVVYCSRNNLTAIASGYTTYEQDFPEQMPVAVQLTRSFLKEYGITYLTPVYEYASRLEVKYGLFDFGISIKAFEGISLFSDTYSTPTAETVAQYIKDKLPICQEYIKLKLHPM
jgi:predicted subunit of tRNA(5-methylaminomethyl-2-thiouridylate) methyltransferase